MNSALSIYLDLLRLIAAVMVVVFHINADGVTGRMLWRIAGYGPDGVIIFFVLSGFVISFVAARQEPSSRAFVVARAARIYSVAVVAIPLTLLADAIGRPSAPLLYDGHTYFNGHTTWIDIVSSLTFTNEIWSRHVIVGSDEPYWSLGFEVWYYLVFGVAFYVRGWVGRVGSVLLLVAGGPRIAMYFAIWLLGWAVFRIIERARAVGRPVVHPALGAAMYILTPCLYVLLHANVPAVGGAVGSSWLDGGFLLRWGYDLAVGALVSFHLIGFVSIARWMTPLTERFGGLIRWSAGATFTLYLTHQPIMLCLSAIAPWPAGSVARLLFVCAGIGGSVLVVAELGERRKRFWRNLFWRLMSVRQDSQPRRALKEVL